MDALCGREGKDRKGEGREDVEIAFDVLSLFLRRVILMLARECHPG